MPLIILSLIFQVAFVIHVLKTGRNTYWIYLLVMLPMVGSIAYFIIELLPDLLGSSTGRQVRKKTTKMVNPNQDYKTAARNYAISGTVDNARKIAAEYIDKKMYKDAQEICLKSMTGLYQYDPQLMTLLASSQFHLQQYLDTKTTLDLLINENPDYRDHDAHLMYARTLVELNETEKALEEYKALTSSNPEPEIILHYGTLLEEQGMTETAIVCYRSALEKADLAPGFYKRNNRYWLSQIKTRLNAL